MQKGCFDTRRVKVTVEGQMFDLVRSITSTFINGYKKFPFLNDISRCLETSLSQ